MNTLSSFTTSDGCRIAWRLDGEEHRPVLVLSNSIGTSLHMWDGEIDALASRFRVLRYDTRGHGASGAPSGDYPLARLGMDVVELLDHLGIERAHFLGLSLGGIIGQWLGIHAAGRIERLVLANTSSYLGPVEQWKDRIESTLRVTDMTETAETFLRNWFPARMLDAREPVVERFRAMLLETDPRGLAGCYAAVRDTDLRTAIASIHVPTLVIAGRYDTVTAASHSEAIAATIPGAMLFVLPAVHLSNVEFPREFVRTVTGFLDEA
jgi:3-oxoadipate enol-lactonase